MKFGDLPVGSVFELNGQRYRKENLLGKSRMLCNASRLRPDEDLDNPEREVDWVRFDNEALIPFPNDAGLEVLSYLGTEIPGIGRIIAVRQGNPPACEVEFQAQMGEETAWWSASYLRDKGVAMPFLPPKPIDWDAIKLITPQDIFNGVREVFAGAMQ